MEQDKCDDILAKVGGEVAKAGEGQKSDEDALVAINEIVRGALGESKPPSGTATTDQLAEARNARFASRDYCLDDELLIDGQEEVFSRTEVERGMIEHHSLEEDTSAERAARVSRPGAGQDAAPDPERPDGGPAGGAD